MRVKVIYFFHIAFWMRKNNWCMFANNYRSVFLYRESSGESSMWQRWKKEYFTFRKNREFWTLTMSSILTNWTHQFIRLLRVLNNLKRATCNLRGRNLGILLMARMLSFDFFTENIVLFSAKIVSAINILTLTSLKNLNIAVCVVSSNRQLI